MAENAAQAWQEDEEQAEPSEYYHRQWKAYAFRRNAAFFFVYTWPVVVVGLFVLSRYYIHQPVLSIAGMVIWLGVAVGLVFWAGEFRCPRCRRRYAALGHRKGDTNMTRGIFDKVCSNCKLRKFEHG